MFINQIAIRKFNHRNQLGLLLVIISIFIVNLLFLTDYPYIHSDEAWLSGFTRTVVEKETFKTSEYFFNTYPRPIHGLKIIFVSLQIVIMKVLGYSPTSFRLLSLIASMIPLYLIGIYFVKKKSFLYGTLISILLGFQIQFILMSHTARQESLILLLMIAVWYLIEKQKHPILIGLIIAIGIGIHPNSFLIACGAGSIYLYKIWLKEYQLKSLVQLVITVASGALIFILISFYLNPNFFYDYMHYGEQLGVINHSLNRFEGFYYYYYKLFNQIGGTYLLVKIKLEILLILIWLALGFILIYKKKASTALLMLYGINVGYFLIGRYNQTAIIFSVVFSLIILMDYIRKWQWSYLPLIILVLFTVNTSYHEIISTNYEAYSALSQQISIIPPDAKILGNLNLEYHLNYDQLLDYRNLWDLKDGEFQDYLTQNSIEYIVFSEELSYIESTSPKWDILYGPMAYYDEMIRYLETCEIVHTFESRTYGMRIARYIEDYPWTITIYKCRP